MPRKRTTPSLRRHKPSSQGVVTLNAKDRYLGRWHADQKDPPTEVRAEYDRVIMEWLASNRGLAQPTKAADQGPTFEDLLAAFWEHAQQHYRHPDGKQTSELASYRDALRPLRHLYAKLPAREFTP